MDIPGTSAADSSAAATSTSPASAPRRIVICLDGTNNEPGSARTNVQRIYRVISRIPGRQLTYYQPGVGTLEPLGVVTSVWRRVLMLADSASGWMMKRHACAAYEYLCETYRPGDEVYLFGFSRGAQSARILAGMLTTVGLLHPGMREMVPFAWKMYTSWAPFTALRRIGESLGMRRNKQDKRAYFKRVMAFQKWFGRPVRIKFMGLWDTVSSVGLPWNPKLYHQSDSNHGVDIVRHALALDEHRVGFEPRPWMPATAEQDVEEVWFPGVHADVGGGYGGTACETAKISLAWMIAELSRTTPIQFNPHGLQRMKLPNLFDPKAVAKAANRSNHDELRKWGWKAVELMPFPRWIRYPGGWKITFYPHLGKRRQLPDDAHVHSSAIHKMQHYPHYSPPLPQGMSVVT